MARGDFQAERMWACPVGAAERGMCERRTEGWGPGSGQATHEGCREAGSRALRPTLCSGDRMAKEVPTLSELLSGWGGRHHIPLKMRQVQKVIESRQNFFWSSLGLHPRHMEVPRLGV